MHEAQVQVHHVDGNVETPPGQPVRLFEAPQALVAFHHIAPCSANVRLLVVSLYVYWLSPCTSTGCLLVRLAPPCSLPRSSHCLLAT